MSGDDVHNTRAGGHGEMANFASVYSSGSENIARTPNIRLISCDNIPNNATARDVPDIGVTSRDSIRSGRVGGHAEDVGLRSVFTSSSQNSARNPNDHRLISYDKVLNSATVSADSDVDELLRLVTPDRADYDGALRSVLADDSLIRRYASLRMRSMRESGSFCDSVFDLRRELRILSELTVDCRRRKPLSAVDLCSLIHPDHFFLVISAARSQPSLTVDVLGRAVNVKLLDSVQRDDNGAARHAWNFRELFLHWRNSLADDNDGSSVLPSSEGNLPQSGGPGYRPSDQSVSGTDQQSHSSLSNAAGQPETGAACTEHGNYHCVYNSLF